MKKAYMEVLVKGGMRGFIDVDMVKVIYLSPGDDCMTLVSPDRPMTIVLKDDTQIDAFGFSIWQLMEALKMYGRIDGWLPLPS